MRIAFAGTPAFAATALQALLAAGYEVCLVLSQPDRPAGRGQQLHAAPVKRLALERAIPVLTPSSLRVERAGEDAEQALAQLRAARPDVLVVAAYGLLLPLQVLQLPRGLALPNGSVGAINIHASLLPRWRGAAPVVRAIEAGDRQSGITIMQMDAGLDTGPILLMESIEIGAEETATELTERLALLGGRLIVTALRQIAQGQLQSRAQPSEGIVYARKVEKREAWIDWREPAERLAARVRAFDPFPGACGRIAGQTIKFWRARALAAPRRSSSADATLPGTVLDVGAEGVIVACGEGLLRLEQLQRAGGRRLEAREFLARTPIAVGAKWERPERAGDAD
jgi:methionyl-tRNA formyltransferase